MNGRHGVGLPIGTVVKLILLCYAHSVDRVCLNMSDILN